MLSKSGKNEIINESKLISFFSRQFFAANKMKSVLQLSIHSQFWRPDYAHDKWWMIPLIDCMKPELNWFPHTHVHKGIYREWNISNMENVLFAQLKDMRVWISGTIFITAPWSIKPYGTKSKNAWFRISLSGLNWTLISFWLL